MPTKKADDKVEEDDSQCNEAVMVVLSVRLPARVGGFTTSMWEEEHRETDIIPTAVEHASRRNP